MQWNVCVDGAQWLNCSLYSTEIDSRRGFITFLVFRLCILGDNQIKRNEKYGLSFFVARLGMRLAFRLVSMYSFNATIRDAILDFLLDFLLRVQKIALQYVRNAFSRSLPYLSTGVLRRHQYRTKNASSRAVCAHALMRFFLLCIFVWTYHQIALSPHQEFLCLVFCFFYSVSFLFASFLILCLDSLLFVWMRLCVCVSVLAFVKVD